MALAERLQVPLRDTTVTLAARGRLEDGDTFSDLVRQYDRTVHNVIRSMVHNPEDVEDVAQEVWIKVANNLANLRDQSRFLPWLYRISRNCALSFLSTQKNRNHVANTDDEDQVESLASPAADGPEQQAISVAERREVWAALAALSEADRTVLLLREFHELPYADIARELKISRGNAEVRVFRARSRFRQQFVKREGTFARGLLGMPLFGALGKLRLLFGGSAAASTAGATGAAIATTGGSGAAATGIGAAVVAKIAVTAMAISFAAGAITVAAPEILPSTQSIATSPAAATQPVSSAAFAAMQIPAATGDVPLAKTIAPGDSGVSAALPGVTTVAATVAARLQLPTVPSVTVPGPVAAGIAPTPATTTAIATFEVPPSVVAVFPVPVAPTTPTAPTSSAPTISTAPASPAAAGDAPATQLAYPTAIEAPAAPSHGRGNDGSSAATDHGNAPGQDKSTASAAGNGSSGGDHGNAGGNAGGNSASAPGHTNAPAANPGQDKVPAASTDTTNAAPGNSGAHANPDPGAGHGNGNGQDKPQVIAEHTRGPH